MDNEQNEQAPRSEWNQPLQNLQDVIECVQWLMSRVSYLETKLDKYETGSVPSIRKLEYRIGKLFVKELSGTLNIGITSIGKDTSVTDFANLTEGDLTESEDDAHEQSWYYDEGWFSDPSSSVPR
jgi:hypothetical protein